MTFALMTYGSDLQYDHSVSVFKRTSLANSLLIIPLGRLQVT